MDHAERDEVWFRSLDMASAAAGADDRGSSESRLRRAIDAATRTRDYIDYREARGLGRPAWTRCSTRSLNWRAGPRAGIVMDLAERRDRPGGGGDDRFDRRLRRPLRRAARTRRGYSPASRRRRSRSILSPLARDLFRRELESEYGVFDARGGTPMRMSWVTPAGRNIADWPAEAWESAAAAVARLARAWTTEAATIDDLITILDRFAERRGRRRGANRAAVARTLSSDL